MMGQMSLDNSAGFDVVSCFTFKSQLFHVFYCFISAEMSSAAAFSKLKYFINK